MQGCQELVYMPRALRTVSLAASWRPQLYTRSPTVLRDHCSVTCCDANVHYQSLLLACASYATPTMCVRERERERERRERERERARARARARASERASERARERERSSSFVYILSIHTCTDINIYGHTLAPIFFGVSVLGLSAAGVEALTIFSPNGEPLGCERERVRKREGERERERARGRERKRARKGLCVCVCVCVRARARDTFLF